MPERREVVRFLRRTLRKALGKLPKVHLRRSFTQDSTMYSVVEHNGRQYVSVATPTPRKRCALPGRGRGRVSGNIRIVLHQDHVTATMHVPYDVRLQADAACGPAVRIDVGVTEVLATCTGEKLGTGYGTRLEHLSRETTETGKARNKLSSERKN